MASSIIPRFGLQLLLLISLSLFQFQLNINATAQLQLHYHNGTLLTGPLTINLLWYGKFNPSQMAIISDFVTSLEKNNHQHPSVSTWWRKAIDKYYHFPGGVGRGEGAPTAKLGRQLHDQNYSLGKSLSRNQIVQVAAKDNINNSGINVVLTADDVAVDGFCRSKCGTHGWWYYSSENINRTYIWIGNSKTLCPGYCAWPFHHQSLTVTSPNNDMGLDGMVANFAGLLAATVTNPFGNGYYQGQGETDAPLEAASACHGVYAGDLLVDPIIGATYNANGANGRRYLVPAIYDPITNTCSTLI